MTFPPLVDTHCHFEAEDDAPALVAEAAQTAVRVVAVGGNAALNATARAAGVPFATGYDWSLGRPLSGEELAAVGDGAAVGELGFDLHYVQGAEAERLQRANFELQAERARALGLPVIVHTREADALTLETLCALALPRAGIIHSYTGGRDFAFRLLDLGYFISFSGILTFRNADALREVAKAVPADRLLVETDAPYLAPVPLRGRRNRPAYVRHTAQALADLRGVPLETLAAQLTANAAALGLC